MHLLMSFSIMYAKLLRPSLRANFYQPFGNIESVSLKALFKHKQRLFFIKIGTSFNRLDKYKLLFFSLCHFLYILNPNKVTLSDL